MVALPIYFLCGSWIHSKSSELLFISYVEWLNLTSAKKFAFRNMLNLLLSWSPMLLYSLFRSVSRAHTILAKVWWLNWWQFLGSIIITHWWMEDWDNPYKTWEIDVEGKDPRCWQFTNWLYGICITFRFTTVNYK